MMIHKVVDIATDIIKLEDQWKFPFWTTARSAQTGIQLAVFMHSDIQKCVLTQVCPAISYHDKLNSHRLTHRGWLILKKHRYFYVQLMILDCKHHLSERQTIAASYLILLSLVLYYVFHFWWIKNNHINKLWPKGSRPERKAGRGRNGGGWEGSHQGNEALWAHGLFFGAP